MRACRVSRRLQKRNAIAFDDERHLQSALMEAPDWERRVMTNQIIIIGFMGTGKTTVALELARKLNCRAIDLDDLIAITREGRSPKEIIEQDGESRFREIETEALREVLQDETARVVAVGGGAWTIAGESQTDR